MEWLNPAGAWAFLGLIPVVLLYMLRRKAKRVRVPSLVLWRLTQQRADPAHPFERLRNQLLLWLQVALVALMALALMRPVSAGGERGESVLIFDLSASMQTRNEAGVSRLEEAQQAAYSLLGGMRDGDAVTVLAAGSPYSQVLSRSTDRAAIRQAIAGLQAQSGGSDLSGALALANAMRRDIPGLRVTVFSDSAISDQQAELWAVGSPVANRSILSARVLEQEEGNIAFCRVLSRGADVMAEMECLADGRLCDARTVSLPDGVEQSVSFLLPEDVETVCVRFSQSDALAVDDERFAVRERPAGHTALLVTQDNVFVQTALSLRSSLSVTAASPSDAQASGKYDLYVYDGLVPDALPESGSLMVFAPNREVLGVVPGPAQAAAAFVRAAAGSTANALCENLALDEIALLSFHPLLGGTAVWRIGEDALLSVTEQNGRRAAIFGFDVHESNLPLKADFPLLIQNLLDYLLPEASASATDAVCGDSVDLRLDERTLDAYVSTPSGARAEAPGGLLSDTSEAGLYTLVERFEDGQRQTAFALHAPLAESDTLTVADSTQGEHGQGEPGGQEWTVWLLLLALLTLLAEWEVSRRGV